MRIAIWAGICFAASTAWAGGAAIGGKVSAAAHIDEVVVYLESVTGAAAAAAPAPKMTQRNTDFVPGSVVVVQGQKVDFPNEDKFFHNVFSVTPGNEFDLGLYRGGISKSVQMIEPGEVDVYCNIHPNMSAKILVLQNAYFARVTADGGYTLPGVPPGKYTLVAWSPRHEPVKKMVLVTASGARVDFSLTPRAATPNHLNKNGEQYGRYK